MNTTPDTFTETTDRAVTLYAAQSVKNLAQAAAQACTESGSKWNPAAIQRAAYAIIFA